MCLKCSGSGMIVVSLADPENGPTNDPADEIGFEYCDCPRGEAKWLRDVREYEQEEAAWFHLNCQR